MAKSELEKYKDFVSAQLRTISPLLQRYALGDFSEVIQFPEKENEFTELFVAINLMVDDIQEMINEKDETINQLELAENEIRTKNEQLKESKQFVETILDTSPDIIYIYDIVEKKNVYSNEGIRKVLDYTVDEIKKMGASLIPILMHPDDFQIYLEKTLPRYQDAKDNELIEHEYRMKHKNGKWRWLYSRELIFKRQENEIPKQIFCIITDITDTKDAVGELKKLNEELEHRVFERTKELHENIHKLNKSQKAMLYMVEDLNKTSKALKEAQEELIQKERLAILGHFSGSISHELRNPLGVIDSSVYYLEAKLKGDDEKVQQHLVRIKSSVDNATSIIQSMLGLTRMTKPVMNRNDLVSIVAESLHDSKIPERIKITQNFPNQDIVVNVEREQCRIAFKNIIKNGIDAMDGGGELALMIRKTKDHQAEVSFVDTGYGVATENLDKIFQPLFTTKARGIGFGLSVAKMIIENHGGTIKVESEQGKGSTFTINLPL